MRGRSDVWMLPVERDERKNIMNSHRFFSSIGAPTMCYQAVVGFSEAS